MPLHGVTITRLIFKLHGFHHVPMLVTMWGLFSLTAIISFALKAYAGDGRFSLRALRDAHFPPEPWHQRSAKFDVVIYVITNVVYRIPFRVAGPAVTAALLAQALTHIMPHHQFYHAGFIALICCCAMLFLVSDFAHYFSHSVQHVVPVLWEFHKVHHSATFLSPLTGDRRHPFCIYFDAVTATVIIGGAAGVIEFIFGFNLVEMFLMTAGIQKIGYLVVLDSLKHSHFAVGLGVFENVLSSPRMHQIHHSSRPEHLGKNFGDVLCIWDFCFGSRYIPAQKETMVLGLEAFEQPEYETLRNIYFGPFLKAGRLMKDRLRGFGIGVLRPANGYHGPRTPAALNEPEADMSPG